MFEITIYSDIDRKINATRKQKLKNIFENYTIKQMDNYYELKNNEKEIKIFNNYFIIKSNEEKDIIAISNKIFYIMEYIVCKEILNQCTMTAEIHAENSDEVSDVDDEFQTAILLYRKLIKFELDYDYLPMSNEFIITFNENPCKISFILAPNKLVVELTDLFLEISEMEKCFLNLKELKYDFFKKVENKLNPKVDGKSE